MKNEKMEEGEKNVKEKGRSGEKREMMGKENRSKRKRGEWNRWKGE